MTTPNPKPGPDADLWILAGQSNMEGTAPFRDPFRSAPRLASFDMDYQWGPAVPPLHHRYAALDPVHRIVCEELGHITPKMFDQLARRGRRATPNQVGPGYFFGRMLLQHLPEATEIALLPCAHGGSTLSQWSPDRPGEPGTTLYNAMLKRWRASGLGAPRGVLWYQGESEALNGQHEDYLERFLVLVDRMREDFGVPDLPVLTCQLSRVAGVGDAGPWEAVREAQRQAPDKRRQLYMTSTLDATLCDRIHIDAASQQRLGERLARLALTEVYRVGRYGRMIRLESLHADSRDDTIHVRMRFGGVQGRLVAPGAPAGFSTVSSPGIEPADPWRVQLNSDGPGTLTVSLFRPETLREVAIAYGAGGNPCCNIADEADMPLPALPLTPLRF